VRGAALGTGSCSSGAAEAAGAAGGVGVAGPATAGLRAKPKRASMLWLQPLNPRAQHNATAQQTPLAPLVIIRPPWCAAPWPARSRHAVSSWLTCKQP
jgi:hypothetical protein